MIIFLVARLAVSGTGLSFTLKDTLSFMAALLILSASRKSFWFIAFPFLIFYAIYLPIGKNFGPPSFKYIASVLATDGNETKEFLKQIPIKHFFYSFCLIGGSIFFRLFTKQYQINYLRNKTIWLIIALIFIWPANFFKSPKLMYKSITSLYEEHKKLQELTVEPAWNITKVKPQYDTYVLVIGESARKDFHHAYGYPIDNTPFLSSTKGIIIDGMTGGGTNTIASLRLMLTKSDKTKWDANYRFNIVDLANKAGYQTHWLSNQGYVGTFDTTVTAIANKSQFTHFIKKADSFSTNTDDAQLLPIFENSLHQKGKKLVVLHLYGSHPYVCDRLHGFEPKYSTKDPHYNDLTCYVASIEKTDQLLYQINNILENRFQINKESYSMIYFADHGLVQRTIDDNITINNNFAIQEHFDIPLVKISSDDHERKNIKSFKSGLNFTEGLGHWLRITSNQFDENTLLFDTSIHNDYGLEVKRSNYPENPAIDISDK